MVQRIVSAPGSGAETRSRIVPNFTSLVHTDSLAISVRAFQKKITERVTVNYISWSITKKYHGPSLKELLKLSFSEGRHEKVQGLYMVKDLEI